MNGRAISRAEMNTFRLTSVIPERIVLVSRGITIYNLCQFTSCPANAGIAVMISSRNCKLPAQFSPICVSAPRIKFPNRVLLALMRNKNSAALVLICCTILKSSHTFPYYQKDKQAKPVNLSSDAVNKNITATLLFTSPAPVFDGFDARSVHARFVDQVARGQAFLQYFSFSLSVSFHQCSIHILRTNGRSLGTFKEAVPFRKSGSFG